MASVSPGQVRPGWAISPHEAQVGSTGKSAGKDQEEKAAAGVPGKAVRKPRAASLGGLLEAMLEEWEGAESGGDKPREVPRRVKGRGKAVSADSDPLFIAHAEPSKDGGLDLSCSQSDTGPGECECCVSDISETAATGSHLSSPKLVNSHVGTPSSNGACNEASSQVANTVSGHIATPSLGIGHAAARDCGAISLAENGLKGKCADINIPVDESGNVDTNHLVKRIRLTQEQEEKKKKHKLNLKQAYNDYMLAKRFGKQQRCPRTTYRSAHPISTSSSSSGSESDGKLTPRETIVAQIHAPNFVFHADEINAVEDKMNKKQTAAFRQEDSFVYSEEDFPSLPTTTSQNPSPSEEIPMGQSGTHPFGQNAPMENVEENVGAANSMACVSEERNEVAVRCIESVLENESMDVPITSSNSVSLPSSNSALPSVLSESLPNSALLSKVVSASNIALEVQDRQNSGVKPTNLSPPPVNTWTRPINRVRVPGVENNIIGSAKELLLKQATLSPTDIRAYIKFSDLEYDLVFKTSQGLEFFWQDCDNFRNIGLWENFRVIPMTKPDTRMVTILLKNDRVPPEDILLWLKKEKIVKQPLPAKCVPLMEISLQNRFDVLSESNSWGEAVEEAEELEGIGKEEKQGRLELKGRGKTRDMETERQQVSISSISKRDNLTKEMEGSCKSQVEDSDELLSLGDEDPIPSGTQVKPFGDLEGDTSQEDKMERRRRKHKK
ncbi:hypothetical protein XELAEV_18032428mg [Xenopus laevis]|uniref:Zinc finger CCHC domain-containing protein n=1 Tax=Xenopus laevis TaxID=8355 RepID=A0A974CPG5_XENLA|nr:hypothetical protein XELAEV_18032428mg [Xenopus laevis]